LTIDVEEVERHELATLHGAADDALKARLQLQSVTVGGALVSIAGALPPSSIVVNRTIGLGLSGPEDPETIRRIVALYREAGVARYFVHVHPDAQPPGIRDWLLEAGLEKARGWMKFTRGRDAPPPAATDLTIRPAVTADGDEPAGTGGLYVRDGIGFCDFGATAPAFRRRGSQSALLRRRIMDAIDMGCRMIVTETGEEVEGDPQHSYKNILRMGFEEAYVRENYAPPR
jgi:GNAT superfamily N-acetyltransferase